MTYWESVATVVAAHREEVSADLDRLRHERGRLQEQLRALDERIATHEHLLCLVSEVDGAAAVEQDLTLHEAMATVLRDSLEQRLRAPDLAQEINRRGLYRMRDGRPVEPQQVHARVGHYGQMFIREGTFIKLSGA